MEQTFGLHLLPAETREFIMRHSRPRRDLLASYWEDIFAMTPEQASAMVKGAVAAVAAAGPARRPAHLYGRTGGRTWHCGRVAGGLGAMAAAPALARAGSTSKSMSRRSS
jgi:hypothetical protein